MRKMGNGPSEEYELFVSTSFIIFVLLVAEL